MTEAEWLACTDNPGWMLKQVCLYPNTRKLGLLSCAALRRVWNHLPGPERRIVEQVQQAIESSFEGANWADDLIEVELTLSARVWDADTGAFTPDWDEDTATLAAAVLPAGTSGLNLWDWGPVEAETERAAAYADSFGPAVGAAWRREHRGQCDLLREIFGSPGHRPRILPAWLAWDGGVVGRIALNIAEVGRFEDLSVLADALEEAGCTDAALLAHLRQPAGHVPGCWALDAVLGQEPVVWAGDTDGQ